MDDYVVMPPQTLSQASERSANIMAAAMIKRSYFDPDTIAARERAHYILNQDIGDPLPIIGFLLCGLSGFSVGCMCAAAWWLL